MWPFAVAAEVNKEEQNLGIVIDAYGAGPFMVATKIKGMVAAEVSDERSAYMTRGHNNSRMITMGAELVGDELAKNIAKGFVNGKYDGGRHQIRVDMLNKMPFFKIKIFRCQLQTLSLPFLTTFFFKDKKY